MPGTNSGKEVRLIFDFFVCFKVRNLPFCQRRLEIVQRDRDAGGPPSSARESLKNSATRKLAADIKCIIIE